MSSRKRAAADPPATSTATADGNADDKARKARKRATDRRAQREHRLRQKAYVRELEASVKNFSSAGSHDETVRALILERNELQKQCDSLKAKLDQVRSLVCDSHGEGERGGGCQTRRRQHVLQASDYDASASGVLQGRDGDVGREVTKDNNTQERPKASDVPNDDDDDADTRPSGLCVDSGYQFDNNNNNNNNNNNDEVASGFSVTAHSPRCLSPDASPSPGGLHDHDAAQMQDSEVAPPQSLNHDHNLFDVHGLLHLDFSHYTSAGSLQPPLHTDCFGDSLQQMEWVTPTGTLPAGDLDNQENMENFGARPLSTPETGISLSCSLAPAATPSPLDLGSLFPRYSAPRSRVDQMLWSMVEEARNEHLQGRFDTSEPSLSRLLSAVPVDTLSFRLFHYVRLFGPAPLHVALAVFWTQYLFLRWHVLQTPAAYERVPKFFRPSAVERCIPHRFLISMLVWPDMRELLVRDSELIEPESVGVEAMRNLEPNWSATSHDPTSVRLDVLHIVEMQSCSPDFWKLDRRFLDKFPQLSSCTSLR